MKNTKSFFEVAVKPVGADADTAVKLAVDGTVIDVDVLKNNLFDEYRFELQDEYFEHHSGQKLNYKEIVEKNNFKGFAIWIDKSLVGTFDREAYEFLYLVRNDIALTKTEDDRVAINRATMTKFGFKVAELKVVFVKD